VEDSLVELFQVLKNKPFEVNFVPERLSDELMCIVTEELNRKHSQINRDFFLLKYWKEIRKRISDPKKFTPLVIYCNPIEIIVEEILKKEPLAKWGLTHPKRIALVYNHNKYILWHEILHLFGAEDCYDYDNPHGKLKCGLQNCLMQYAPILKTVGERPVLCKENIKLIQMYDKKSNNN
jgi:hypothetical protein